MRRESSSAASTRGTSTRMSMTLAISARSISMRRDSSNFSWNIQRLIAASMRDAHRLDQDDDGRRRQQRVEEEQPLLFRRDPADQDAVDQRQDEHQRAQHQHAAQQLVQIEQPVAHQVLRQEVHVDDDEDVPEARAVGHHLQQRRGDGGDAADHQVQEARLLDAGRRRAVARVEVEAPTGRGRRRRRPGTRPRNQMVRCTGSTNLENSSAA